MKKNSSKKLAKLFALFLDCATLFVPMTVLTSCGQPATQQVQQVQETLPLKEGVIDWNKFLQVARTGEGTTYTFKEFQNSNDLKGFTGTAIYEDLLTVLKDSIYGSRLYDTTGLKVFFKDTEITPTIIETLLRKISKLNISAANDKGETSPVKISSGNTSAPDIFDVDRYDKYLKNNKITLDDDAEIRKSSGILLLGTKYVDDQDTKITDKDKVLYLLNSKLFKFAKLHRLNFDGNLVNIMKILGKENSEYNIKFTQDSFFAAELKDKNLNLETMKKLYEIPSDYIKQMKLRGSKIKLENVKIQGLGYGTTLADLNDSSFKNVYFTKHNDLRTIDFNNVQMSGIVVMSGKLPTKMEYANIDGKLILEKATSAMPDGTLLTDSYIKYLEIKNLTGIENLKVADENKGQIDRFKGRKDDYEMLTKIFDINKNNLDVVIGYNIQKTR